MERVLRVLFVVSNESQIEPMNRVLSSKNTFGDDIHVSTVNKGGFDIVIDVGSKFKDKCIIFDHGGTVHRLGMPCDIEYDELPNDEPDEEGKKKAKEKEKKEKLPKECSKCTYMKPAGIYVCPRCGHKPLYGENGEVDETRGLTKIKGAAKKYSTADKEAFYRMLLGYGKQHDYKEGWAAIRYKEKFGIYPSNRFERKPLPPSMEVMNFIRSINIRNSKARAAK